MKTIFVQLLILGFFAALASCYDVRDLLSHKIQEKRRSRRLLDRGFNKDERPPGIQSIDDPVYVNVSMYIGELGFCPEHQQLTIGGYFRQHWYDVRLAVPSQLRRVGNDEVTLQFRDMFEDRRIWVPDTFSAASRDSLVHDTDASTGGRSFLRAAVNGKILASFRMRTKLSCPVAKDATEVKCKVAFESYGYTADDVVYGWKDDTIMISNEARNLLENSGWVLESDPEKGVDEVSVGKVKFATITLTFSLKKA